MQTEKLEPGNYYHIYNRGNNGGALFFENENYLYFLRLYEKYMASIANTLAWCLMKNHFHFLIYFKEKEEILKNELLIKEPSRQLSHLFNSYPQAVNRKYGRTGSLFERPFERKKIDSEKYLKQLILYIHNNPVNHNVVENVEDYKWSSYHVMVSSEPTTFDRQQVIDLFGDLENFKACHKN
ncbi:MAG: hypothetical protein WBL27_00125 [Salinimicrobium sp.]